jgi:hypothetical protein
MNLTKTSSVGDTAFARFLTSVFTYMALGLVVAGLVGGFVGTNPVLMAAIFGNTILKWVVLLLPLALVFVITPVVAAGGAIGLMGFLAFTASMGLSTAGVFALYTLGSIGSIFFITAGMFGGMAAFGLMTKRDLSAMGSFLIMVVWGLILVGLVNIFIGSAMISTLFSVVAVIAFAGLTAYDLQKLRTDYFSGANTDGFALLGALTLFLDFINIFLNLLSLFGVKKD